MHRHRITYKQMTCSLYETHHALQFMRDDILGAAQDDCAIFHMEKHLLMEQMTADPFGEVLKSFRKRKRLSQQALAERLGVHRNTISIWERGDFLP